MCKRNFSRKGNAFRHNTKVHSDLSEIVLSSMNPSRIPKPSKGLKNAQANKFLIFKNMRSAQKLNDDDDYLDDILFTENDEIDSKIIKIIGQMIKPYLELESFLNSLSPQEKATVLTMAFSSSLLSFNLVKSLHEISEIYRSFQGLDIIAKHWASANNIPVPLATVFVRDAINNSTLIHRMNN